ncbi:MAG: hypothetical protein ACLU61_08645 [Lachnospiraceae bacterium]
MQEFLRENGQIVMMVIVVAVLVALVVALSPTASKAIKDAFENVSSVGVDVVVPTFDPASVVR